MGRKSNIHRIEKRFGKPINQILDELYSQGNLKYVSEALGTSIGTVFNYIKHYGIKKKAKTKDISAKLPELISDFLISKRIGGKTEATIEFYRANLHRFLWWLQNFSISLSLESFNPQLIRRFLFYLQTKSNRFGGKSTSARVPASRSTLDAYWRTFQSFGSWLVNEGKLRESPIKRVEKPGQDKVVIPDIPKETLISMLGTCDNSFLGKRNRAIILLFLDTGIRLNEIVQIKLSDFNSNTGLIKVNGKGRKERIVRIGTFTKKALTKYLKIRESNSPYLWLSEYRKPLGKRGIHLIIRRLKRLNPNIKISPHIFRHTFAIDLLRAGGDVYALQTLGGWENLEIPRMYSETVQQEHALKVHEKASPVDFLFKNDKRAI